MNWELFEEIMRRKLPTLPAGLIDECVAEYRGEHLDLNASPLTSAQEKIVRDAFIKASDRPDARDNARRFIAWAFDAGFDIKVNERFKSCGNISGLVRMFWETFDEEETVSTVTDPRIRYIFKRLSFWTKRDRLYFLQHHSPSKLSYYAFLVNDARPEIIEDQDAYVSPKGVLLDPNERMESLFRSCNTFHDWENIKFWEAVVDKDWKGGPKKRPEWILGTPEWEKRMKG